MGGKKKKKKELWLPKSWGGIKKKIATFKIFLQYFNNKS